jgi:hypothetical protein
MSGSGHNKSRWIKVEGEHLHGFHYWSLLPSGRLLIDTHVSLPAPGVENDARRVTSLTRPGPFAGASEGATREVNLEVHGLSLSGIADFSGRRFVSFAASWIRRDGETSRRRIDRYIIWPAGTIAEGVNQEFLAHCRRQARVEEDWDGAGLKTFWEGDYLAIENVRAALDTRRSRPGKA